VTGEYSHHLFYLPAPFRRGDPTCPRLKGSKVPTDTSEANSVFGAAVERATAQSPAACAGPANPGYGVELCLFNGGGSGGGPIPVGGCSVYYDISQRDGSWLVKYKGEYDP